MPSEKPEKGEYHRSILTLAFFGNIGFFDAISMVIPST
jgi:hypothetical protein